MCCKQTILREDILCVCVWKNCFRRQGDLTRHQILLASTEFLVSSEVPLFPVGGFQGVCVGGGGGGGGMNSVCSCPKLASWCKALCGTPGFTLSSVYLS